MAGEASAYLASAAHQPVHWHPWGEEAFARARAEDKPILLDIGAVWCHWCHVMDRESYEDPAVAEFLNAHFICIKVDRDERPDVDARHQRAVQALTGQGGWPLTAFLTPEGDVFYGGTYFPPYDRFGRQSFRTVLEKVRDVFRAQRDKVTGSGREVRGHVAALLRERAPGPLAPALLEQGAERMAKLFDVRYGGFGSSPKFPHPSAVDFLLARWWDTRQPWLREIVEKTLVGMAEGGVYDQIGGGFHRYSVDERWIVPHFEKMAYDNAELLKVYLHAFAALGDPRFAATALGIVDWTLEVLADPEGGFGASQDADVGLDDDGNYFTWTEEEVRAALTDEEWQAARRRWDIYERGEMSHDPRRNVLWVASGAAAIAQELEITSSQVEQLLASSRKKLKAARDTRTAPAVDRAVYTSWTAMLAEALLEAAAILGRRDAADAALRALKRLWSLARDADGLMRHRAGLAAPPFLDDQVQSASAAIAAYEFTGEPAWLERARALADLILRRFAASDGGFFDSAADAGAGLLGQRAMPIQDAPTPAPNGVAALVFLRLAGIVEDGSYREAGQRTLAAFAGAADLGLFAATWLRGLDFLLNGACRIVVADTTTTMELSGTALATYRPRRVVVHAAASPVPGKPAPVALVCAGTACAAPVTDAASLRSTLETFGRAL
ncbi:MAG TPA: thioredoxin domain-containing protein [Gemmatimonadales bacterium]|nr:thioredoxin domain-containing protein [Gemmatimonadales bacterium]